MKKTTLFLSALFVAFGALGTGRSFADGIGAINQSFGGYEDPKAGGDDGRGKSESEIYVGPFVVSCGPCNTKTSSAGVPSIECTCRYWHKGTQYKNEHATFSGECPKPAHLINDSGDLKCHTGDNRNDWAK